MLLRIPAGRRAAVSAAGWCAPMSGTAAPRWAVAAVAIPLTRPQGSRSASGTAGGNRVLLLGSGNVVQPLVDYLGGKSVLSPTVTIGSVDTVQSEALASQFSRVSTLELDVTDVAALTAAVQQHDVVISLVPWQLHPIVAQVCIDSRVNMVTTSYVSDAMQGMHSAALDAGITILNEVGLDPGIDHLGAMRIIDEVKERGGKIKEFISYCGGLPAAECSFGPLHYKFSWFPKGVLVAGMSQATYRQDGVDITTDPGKLFSYGTKNDSFPTLKIEGYPNRNSIQYEEVYGIQGVDTILRGTLRFEGFCHVMETMRKLQMFDETPLPVLAPGAQPPYNWSHFMLHEVLPKAGVKASTHADVREAMRAFLSADGNTKEQEVYTMSTFERLGLFSSDPVPKAGCLLDALCELMQEKLAYEDGERDMVLLSHDFLAEWADGSQSRFASTLVRTGAPQGEAGGYTAMAETVGMPCALAVEMMLAGKIAPSGVIRPVTKEIYEPLLAALAAQGIAMVESETKL